MEAGNANLTVMHTSSEFTRLDRLNVVVAYGDNPSCAPDEVTLLQLDSPNLHGAPWDDDEFIAELQPLLWAKSPEISSFKLPYSLSVDKRHFSWGADTSVADVVLYIAQHFVEGSLQGAGEAAVLTLLLRLRSRVLPRGDRNDLLIRSDELEDFARLSLRNAYEKWLPMDAPLPLVSESQDDREWTGTFRDDSGNEYSVTLVLDKGQSHPVRISRRAARGQHGPEDTHG